MELVPGAVVRLPVVHPPVLEHPGGHGAAQAGLACVLLGGNVAPRRRRGAIGDHYGHPSRDRLPRGYLDREVGRGGAHHGVPRRAQVVRYETGPGPWGSDRLGHQGDVGRAQLGRLARGRRACDQSCGGRRTFGALQPGKISGRHGRRLGRKRRQNARRGHGRAGLPYPLGWAAVKAGTATADNPNTAMAATTTTASTQGRACLRHRPGKAGFAPANAPVTRRDISKSLPLLAVQRRAPAEHSRLTNSNWPAPAISNASRRRHLSSCERPPYCYKASLT